MVPPWDPTKVASFAPNPLKKYLVVPETNAAVASSVDDRVPTGPPVTLTTTGTDRLEKLTVFGPAASLKVAVPWPGKKLSFVPLLENTSAPVPPVNWLLFPLPVKLYVPVLDPTRNGAPAENTFPPSGDPTTGRSRSSSQNAPHGRRPVRIGRQVDSHAGSDRRKGGRQLPPRPNLGKTVLQHRSARLGPLARQSWVSPLEPIRVVNAEADGVLTVS